MKDKWKDSLTNSGYDPEEAYFHEQNQHLIEELRKRGEHQGELRKRPEGEPREPAALVTKKKAA